MERCDFDRAGMAKLEESQGCGREMTEREWVSEENNPVKGGGKVGRYRYDFLTGVRLQKSHNFL
jgi:hypothetical protein